MAARSPSNAGPAGVTATTSCAAGAARRGAVPRLAACQQVARCTLRSDFRQELLHTACPQKMIRTLCRILAIAAASGFWHLFMWSAQIIEYLIGKPVSGMPAGASCGDLYFALYYDCVACPCYRSGSSALPTAARHCAAAPPSSSSATRRGRCSALVVLASATDATPPPPTGATSQGAPADAAAVRSWAYTLLIFFTELARRLGAC